MTRKFRPFDIVRLSESYIHELRSAPRLRFPAEVILERISEERSEPKRYDYESLVGIVAETDGEQASVVWFNGRGSNVKAAWFCRDELEIIGNAIEAIGNAMAHPAGWNTKQGTDLIFNRKHREDNDSLEEE